MPAANHSFYLRRCYINNDLSQGRIEMGGVTLDLSKVTIPVYHLAAREDHIAPARSVFLGAQVLGGPVRFVVSSSGHIAGDSKPSTRSAKRGFVLGACVRCHGERVKEGERVESANTRDALCELSAAQKRRS